MNVVHLQKALAFIASGLVEKKSSSRNHRIDILTAKTYKEESICFWLRA